MYYPRSENQGADQLRGYREAYLRFCFRICKKPVFSRRDSYYPCSLVVYSIFYCGLSGEKDLDKKIYNLDTNPFHPLSGKGTYKWKENGAIYDGDWKRGKRNGFGTFSKPDGKGGFKKEYSGGWKNDMRHVRQVLHLHANMTTQTPLLYTVKHRFKGVKIMFIFALNMDFGFS